MRLVAAALFVAAFAALATAQPGLAHTDSGEVQGAVEGGIIAWRGVPFGASTAGANRFGTPMPPRPWAGVRTTTTFGDGCFQTHHNPDVPRNVSEDCLNLNVYAPLGATNLPVMLFFHGGSFAEGSDQGPFYMYDASALVAKFPNVVVVTSNYRLGALGWVVTDEIRGNLGLMDQNAAMRWVSRNIANFGGNPAAVTLWGESAGAMSVGVHLINNQSHGLFSRAIMESNVAGMIFKGEIEARGYGMTFCKLLHCLNMSSSAASCNTTCLQQQTPQAVGQAWDAAGGNIPDIVLGNWGHWLSAALDQTPTVDGKWVPGQIVDSLEKGLLDKDVDVLIGSNTGEGITFVYAALNEALPVLLYEAAIELQFGSLLAGPILDFYKNQTPATGDSRDVLSTLLTDYWFHCAAQKFATAAVANGNTGYFYHFDHVFSSSFIFPEFGLPGRCINATCHASELPFVFQSYNNSAIAALNVTFTADEIALSSTFGSLWVQFAVSGTLNPSVWPKWDPSVRNELLLTTPAIGLFNSATVCGFWDKIGYTN